MIPWLNEHTAFPPVTEALPHPNGLLAASESVTVDRLLEAYRCGIFPWYTPKEPVLWWSPDPRMILMPDDLNISRSFAKVLRNCTYQIRTDTSFEQVMRECAAPRTGQDGTLTGTWIDEAMIAAYCALHQMGYAHSVEVWMNDKLVGGLYGVAIGQMFYGESMFSRVSNASKIALAHLTRQLRRWQVEPIKGMIDCQMHTPHLATMGAKEIPRSEFIARLEVLADLPFTTQWQIEPGLFK